MMNGIGYGGIGNCFGFGNGGLMNGGWGMIIMLGITALIITGAVMLAKKKGRRNSDDSVLEALKLRLARGEITEEEYIRRKTILE